MRRFAALLLAACAAPILAGPGGPRLEARAASADGPRVVREAGGERRVESAAGSVRLETPRGASVEAIAALDDGWLVAGIVGRDERQELWLARGDRHGRTRELDAPGDQRSPLRDGPIAVSGAGVLHGVAWLEGESGDRYGVLWAAWTGDGFSSPVTVSPAGAGSQLALTGAVLADGRIVIAWSGYDGEDDEIWASLGDGRGWSAPQRVGGDNAVPDIAPAVIADGTAAWIAWSRFDVESKQYRVARSRYDGRRFGGADLIAPPGSLYPTFEWAGERPALLYRDARAGAWVLGELDGDGRIARRSSLEARGGERPLVTVGPAGVVWRVGSRETVTAWQ